MESLLPFNKIITQYVKSAFRVKTFDSIRKERIGLKHVIVSLLQPYDCIVSIGTEHVRYFEESVIHYIPDIKFFEINDVKDLPELTKRISSYSRILLKIGALSEVWTLGGKNAFELLKAISFLDRVVQTVFIAHDVFVNGNLKQMDLEIEMINKLNHEFYLMHVNGFKFTNQRYIKFEDYYYPRVMILTYVRKTEILKPVYQNCDPLPAPIDDQLDEQFCEVDLNYLPFVERQPNDERFRPLISPIEFARRCNWDFGKWYHQFPQFNINLAKDGDYVSLDLEYLDDMKVADSWLASGKKFNFICICSDAPFDEARFKQFEKMMYSVRSINATYKHPMVKQIPCGIRDYRMDTRKIIAASRPTHVKSFDERPITIYINFTVTRPERFARRIDCYKAFVDHPKTVIKPPTLTEAEYYKDLWDTKYVLSPEGSGLDTYRTYESIYCGAIPVVLRDALTPMLERLPVIIVDKWTDFDPDKKYDLPKLDKGWDLVDYWW
jgi:hypothetical protein